MANFNSLQMTAPRYPVSGPLNGGRSVMIARGEFNLGTQSTGALAIADVVKMLRLHRNFRVVSAFIKTDTAMAGVTVNVGDSGNASRYFAAASLAAIGTNVAMAEAGRDYLTPGFTDVIMTIAGAATTATGQIVLEIHGIVEQPA